jgi:hypothetical protein
MRKRLCACGCGEKITPKVEAEHMKALAPGILASQVLDQNRRLVPRKKKKRKAIGFPAPVRQRLTMRNTPDHEIADMDIDLDDKDPVSLDVSESMMMEEDLDEAYGQSGRIASHVEDSKSFQNISHISQVDQNMYVDHAGPSGLTHMHDDFSLPEDVMDHCYRAPSPLPNDNAGMGGNLDGEVYGLSNFHRSRRIAPHVEDSKSF